MHRRTWIIVAVGLELTCVQLSPRLVERKIPPNCVAASALVGALGSIHKLLTMVSPSPLLIGNQVAPESTDLHAPACVPTGSNDPSPPPIKSVRKSGVAANAFNLPEAEPPASNDFGPRLDHDAEMGLFGGVT